MIGKWETHLGAFFSAMRLPVLADGDGWMTGHGVALLLVLFYQAGNAISDIEVLK